MGIYVFSYTFRTSFLFHKMWHLRMMDGSRTNSIFFGMNLFMCDFKRAYVFFDIHFTHHKRIYGSHCSAHIYIHVAVNIYISTIKQTHFESIRSRVSQLHFKHQSIFAAIRFNGFVWMDMQWFRFCYENGSILWRA